VEVSNQIGTSANNVCKKEEILPIYKSIYRLFSKVYPLNYQGMNNEKIFHHQHLYVVPFPFSYDGISK